MTSNKMKTVPVLHPTIIWLELVLYCVLVNKCISDVTYLFQESLRKIITTLALKNEEIQNFICCLKQSLQNLDVRNRNCMLFF